MLNIPALLLNKNELRWSKLPADDLLEIKFNRVPDWTTQNYRVVSKITLQKWRQF